MPAPKVVNIKGKAKPKPAAASSSSTVPPGTPPPPPPEIVLPTRVVSFDEVDLRLKDLVLSLYDERRNAKDVEDRVIKQRKDLDESLDSILMDLNVVKINMPDGWYIRLTKSTSASRLDAKLLLALGVSADQIKAATVPGNPYKYVSVQEDKGEKEG